MNQTYVLIIPKTQALSSQRCQYVEKAFPHALSRTTLFFARAGRRGPGIVALARAAAIERYRDEGFSFFQASSDLGFLSAAARELLAPPGKAGTGAPQRPLF
jgi:hypothetical protein